MEIKAKNASDTDLDDVLPLRKRTRPCAAPSAGRCRSSSSE
jgi:hypothetical protein